VSVSGFPVSLFCLAFSIPAFSVTPVLTRMDRLVGSCPHFYQTFKMLWQILRADNVCTLWFRYFINTVITVHAVEIFHCINRICKEVLYETFSISFHFHEIVHENTSALTPLCFIWVSRAIAKHARIVLTAFCQCWRFIVNGITEIWQHIAGVQRDVNTLRKRRRRDADIRSAAVAAARRSVMIGGAAVAAHSSRLNK